MAFAAYFLSTETKQLINQKMEYFKSFWNYIDIVPLLGILVVASLMIVNRYYKEIDPVITAHILSVTTFLMWLKFLYFFRLSENTGYLIRLIIEVFKDMRYFFLVILTTTAAFGDSFLKLSLHNNYGPEPEPDSPEAANYKTAFIFDFIEAMWFAYRMILGDSDVTMFGGEARILLVLFWVLFTIFNVIVMLNLLISIMGDTYGRVSSIADQTSYQVRCQMIAENHYLVPPSIKKKYAKQDKFLMIVTS